MRQPIKLGNFHVCLKASLAFIFLGISMWLGISVAYGQSDSIPYQPNQIVVRVSAGVNMAQGRLSAGTAQGFYAAGVSSWTPVARGAAAKARKPNHSSSVNIHDIYTLTLIEGKSVKASIASLEKQPWVVYAEPIYIYSPLHFPNDTYAGLHWGHAEQRGNVFNAWDISKGDPGVVIAIVDTGCILNHKSLVSNFFYNASERYGKLGIDDDGNGYVDDSLGYDFGERDAFAYDNMGHGSGVAGVAGAVVDDNFGSIGVAYRCKVMPIKVSNAQGNIVNGYEAILYAGASGAKIINLSWGRPTGGLSRFEQEIITYVTEEYDALIVAASGNTGANLDFYPASYDNVLSVAHSDEADHIYVGATYSYFIDMMAPGMNMLGPTFTGSLEGHGYQSGSSFASPFVAGIAGLVRSYYPHLKAAQVGELIRQTTDNTYHYPQNALHREMWGKGRADAYRALTEIDKWPAVRMTKFSYQNLSTSLEPYFNGGDTLDIRCSMLNYLAPTSSKAQVSFSVVSNNASIIGDTTRTLGIMQTLGDTLSVGFRLAYHGIQAARIIVRLGISDTQKGYTDYQYFYINPPDDFFNIPYNNFFTTIFSNGRIGFQDDGNGEGLLYKNNGRIREMGLVIAVSPDSVSDCVTAENGTISKDFATTEPTSIEQADAIRIIRTSYDDHRKDSGISLDITQRALGWNTPSTEADYILLDYEIHYQGKKTLDTLYVGVFADWRFPSPNVASTGWDEQGGFGYAYTSSNRWIGFMPLQENPSYYPFSYGNKEAGFDPDNGFSDAEKYLMLSQGKQAGKTLSGDVGSMTGNFVLQVKPDTVIKLVYAVLGGASMQQLRTAAIRARNQADKRYRPELPVMADTFFCANEDFTLRPRQEAMYEFYEDANLTKHLHTGRFYQIPRQMMGQTIYIVQLGRWFKSFAAPFKVEGRMGAGLTEEGEQWLTDGCIDSGWIYFRKQAGQPAGFAIEADPLGKGNNVLSHASVNIHTLNMSRTIGYYKQIQQGQDFPSYASFAMGRHWNLVLGQGDILKDPVNIRFYYDSREAKALEQGALEWALAYRGVQASLPYWIITSETPFAPEEQLTGEGLSVPSQQVYPSRTGTENGVQYVQFNALSKLGGGGLMINSTPSPLPLTLTYFEGVWNDAQKEAVLEWGSVSRGVDAFELQRSNDGFIFSTIATMPVAKSAHETHYSFADKNTEFYAVKWYYRLLWTDEGKQKYSSVVKIEIDPSESPAFYAFYRAGEDVLELWWNGSSISNSVQVLDMQGRILHTQEMGSAKSVQLPTASWKQGCYLLRWSQTDLGGKLAQGTKKISLLR